MGATPESRLRRDCRRSDLILSIFFTLMPQAPKDKLKCFPKISKEDREINLFFTKLFCLDVAEGRLKGDPMRLELTCEGLLV